jgi:hypothetical protein
MEVDEWGMFTVSIARRSGSSALLHAMNGANGAN